MNQNNMQQRPQGAMQQPMGNNGMGGRAAPMGQPQQAPAYVPNDFDDDDVPF
jgi:hypothetical protein